MARGRKLLFDSRSSSAFPQESNQNAHSAARKDLAQTDSEGRFVGFMCMATSGSMQTIVASNRIESAICHVVHA